MSMWADDKPDRKLAWELVNKMSMIKADLTGELSPFNIKGVVWIIGGAILTLGTALGCLSGPSGAADVTELFLHPINTENSPVIQFYGRRVL